MMGYSNIAASMLQVVILRVASQESLIAEANRVVKRRIGAPVLFLDMVVLIAKMTDPSFSSAEMSIAVVVEEQLYAIPVPCTLPRQVPLHWVPVLLALEFSMVAFFHQS
jgi:hypothetical protein